MLTLFVINSEIEAYITKAKSEGTPIETIKTNLLSVGWSPAQVDSILNTQGFLGIPLPPSQATVSKVHYGSMWDSFEHILMFISMYVLYISFALMLHLYIDRWVPGVNSDIFGGSSYASFNDSLLRGYMAALIVSFPLFSYFFLKITKNTKANPTIRNLGSRKFLIYATLIITFIVVLTNVVQAVFGFLNGNVTFNFILHFLDTVGISSIIFIYYLGQVKEDRNNQHA